MSVSLRQEEINFIPFKPPKPDYVNTFPPAT